MHSPTDEAIQFIQKTIAEQFQPEKIILFGSHAWGQPTEDSDIDLLVIKDTADTRNLARKIDGKLFPRTYPIDILVYRPQELENRCQKGDFFAEQIMTKGKVLYEQ